jgi:hypothetical protein
VTEKRIRGEHAPLGAGAARTAFLEWLGEAGPAGRGFLQLWIRPAGASHYEIVHREDRGADPGLLDRSADPFAAREIAQTDARGEHRPLKTSPTLRRGWLLGPLDGRGVCQAMDYLYPACVPHWHAGRTGTLRATDWPVTAGRQSGIYSAVGLLSPTAVGDVVAACCDDSVCLRRVAWKVDVERTGTPPRSAEAPCERDPVAAGHGAAEAVVPCPEACSLFVSLARKALVLERQPRQDTPPLGRLNEPELVQLREVARAAVGASLADVREGDFDHPANRRRVRLLLARLDRESARKDVAPNTEDG